MIYRSMVGWVDFNTFINEWLASWVECTLLARPAILYSSPCYPGCVGVFNDGRLKHEMSY